MESNTHTFTQIHKHTTQKLISVKSTMRLESQRTDLRFK